MSNARIQPAITALSEPYWEGCREGLLRLQQCDACGEYQFYPRVLCSHCGHDVLNWRDVSGRGRIASYTVVPRPLSPAYPSPSIIILVDLDEGPRLMSSLAGGSVDDLAVGAVVSVDFEAWSEDISMPVFQLVTEENT